MVKRRSLVAGRAAVILSCLFVIVAVGNGAPPRTTVPKGWPEQLGERRPYNCEQAFVYAKEKSAAEQIRKTFATVVKDLTREGVAASAGLVLVMDTREKYPCEVAGLLEAIKIIDPNAAAAESDSGLKDIAEAEKQVQELGLDMGTVLSLAPISIRPAILHEVVGQFPEDVDRQIGWCVILPTDRCFKAGLKKIIDAGIKKEKVGLAERAMLATMMPLIERKAVSMMRKERRATLYDMLLSTTQGMTREQKQERVNAYRQKLGLDEEFDLEKDKTGGQEKEQADS